MTGAGNHAGVRAALPSVSGFALTASDRTRLNELEGVVERGARTFVEVGEALMEIRDRRLYSATHVDFDAYCRERFGFSDSRGRQLIAAAKTVTAVTAAGLPAPATERAARELARHLRPAAPARRKRTKPPRAERPLYVQFTDAIGTVTDLLEHDPAALTAAVPADERQQWASQLRTLATLATATADRLTTTERR